MVLLPENTLWWEFEKPGASIIYEKVHVDRASLYRWIELSTSQAAGEQASVTAVREKKKRGRPSKSTPECDAAARRIAVEKKKSRDPSELTDTALIKAFQEWYEAEYGTKAPVNETVRSWLTSWGL